MIERTLIIAKPDAVQKKIVGDIITRFEKVGLSLIGLKMVHSDEELASEHYPLTKEWAENAFNRAKKAAQEKGLDFKHSDPMKYGGWITDQLKEFLQECPIVLMVFEGPHAVEVGRKIVGHTEPRQALPGTIRGDYATVSFKLAEERNQAVRNLVHASGTVEEAEREIKIWFTDEELYPLSNLNNN
ncbi:nucleoside-diphosphate kinase [Candidatus Woesearchaeota archaeon]|nr:nucleoside-diphosphate kinase [Candidatus Woesearchaeota archaeon]